MFKKLFDMFKDMSQLEIITYHLEKHGSIDQKECARLYGDYRLSDKILRLRKQGYEIISHRIPSKNRFGKKTEYVRYELIKKSNTRMLNS